MWTLLSDVYTTRRQRLHHVIDGTGTLRWSGKDLRSAMEFLLNEGHSEFDLDGGDHQDKLHLTIRLL